MSVRLKRLSADYQRVSQLFRENSYIVVKSAIGRPPEKYEIEYKIKGLEQRGNNIAVKDSHLVEVVLTRDYPTEAPICRMLTPVFHPNIAPHAICIGDHWAAGESLADLIIRIGEMICYQSYNIKSPLNGEAARWADKNIARLPIDAVDLTLEKRPEEIVVRRDEAERFALVEEHEEIFKDKISAHEMQIETDIESTQIKIDEAPRETRVQTCPNCGAKGEKIQIQECVNGHFVCTDCIIECQNCEKTICVLCSFTKCHNCEKLICADCQTACSKCHQIVCKKHIGKCYLCETQGCAKCLIRCSKCQRIACDSHYLVISNCCIECGGIVEGKIKISYDELKHG